METYYFDTLLAFLKHQRTIGYEAVETVLDILDEDTHFPEDKKDAILFMLRRWGLYETTLKGGKYQPQHLKEQKIPKEILELDHRTYNGCLMSEMIAVELLNGGILFECCLN